MKIEPPQRITDVIIRQNIADYAKKERRLPELIELPVEEFFTVRDLSAFYTLADGSYRLYDIPLKFY